MGVLTYIKIGLAVAVLVAIAGFYAHYRVVVGERDKALASVGALQTSISVQSETISALEKTNVEWKEALVAFQKTLKEVESNQTEANMKAKELNDVLSRHDLTALSLAKPGLIERRINSGTVDILKLFESVTGGDPNSTGRP